MENVIEFEPLFASADRVLLLPREAVHEVRATALDVYLNEVENELDVVRGKPVQSIISMPSKA